MKKYTFSVYDWRNEPHKHIKNVSERTEGTALAVAGFGDVIKQGGKNRKDIRKRKRERDYSHSCISARDGNSREI